MRTSSWPPQYATSYEAAQGTLTAAGAAGSAPRLFRHLPDRPPHGADRLRRGAGRSRHRLLAGPHPENLARLRGRSGGAGFQRVTLVDFERYAVAGEPNAFMAAPIFAGGDDGVLAVELPIGPVNAS